MSDQNESDRRSLLKAAARVGGVMTAMGLSLSPGVATAQSVCDEAAIEQLFGHILQTGNINEAINLYGAAAGISAEQEAMLQELTAIDIDALVEIQDLLQSGTVNHQVEVTIRCS